MLIKNIVSLVKEYPPVRPKKKSTSGKKPIHSWEKLVCICILMVVFGSTYRNIQNLVPSLNRLFAFSCVNCVYLINSHNERTY